MATYLDPVLAWSVDIPKCGPSIEGMNSILSHLNVSVPCFKIWPKDIRVPLVEDLIIEIFGL